jgi:hypothetical protein
LNSSTITASNFAWNTKHVAHCRIRDPQFRQQQLDRLRAWHIAIINALVDELVDSAGRGWVPCVSALRDAVAVRVLTVDIDSSR